MTEQVWIDPADWVERLNEKLVELDLQYHGLSLIRRMRLDPDAIGNADLLEGEAEADATLTAAAALGTVVAALREIPTFQGNIGLTALTDLGLALADLDRGLRPSLLEPRPGVRSTSDGAGRQLLKANVVLCVELLGLAGEKNASARRQIADIFGRAGFKGRKRGPLSAQTIHEWQNSVAKHGADRETRQIIDNAIRDWKKAGGWPPTREAVISFASDRATDPSLQTKI